MSEPTETTSHDGAGGGGASPDRTLPVGAAAAPAVEATVPPPAFGAVRAGGVEATLPVAPDEAPTVVETAPPPAVAPDGPAPEAVSPNVAVAPVAVPARTPAVAASTVPPPAFGTPASGPVEKTVVVAPASRGPAVGDGPPDVGALVGRFRLLRRLGEGAMGVVFEAEDTELLRRVALKVLPKAVAAHSHELRRFRREALSAGRLQHPNAVSLLDVGQDGATHFLVMELVRGGSVADVLRNVWAMPWREAVRIAADVCRAVAAAHAAGLVHRDIKPGNILIEGPPATLPTGETSRSGTPDLARSTVKLADFGLAKLADHTASVLTKTGTPLGTPAYMAPEQCQGTTIDARSDVYGLGATLFALLTGHPPYRGNVTEVMVAHCRSPIPDPRAEIPGIPESVSAVVFRAMAKAPAARYQTVDEMLGDLEAVLGNRPAPAHRPAPENRPASENRPAPGAPAQPPPAPAAPRPAVATRARPQGSWPGWAVLAVAGGTAFLLAAALLYWWLSAPGR
jgi:hypothetical protein